MVALNHNSRSDTPDDDPAMRELGTVFMAGVVYNLPIADAHRNCDCPFCFTTRGVATMLATAYAAGHAATKGKCGLLEELIHFVADLTERYDSDGTLREST